MLHTDLSTQHPWSLEPFPGVPENLHRSLGENPSWTQNLLKAPVDRSRLRIRLMQMAGMRTPDWVNKSKCVLEWWATRIRLKIEWLLLLKLHVANTGSHAQFSIQNWLWDCWKDRICSLPHWALSPHPHHNAISKGVQPAGLIHT